MLPFRTPLIPHRNKHNFVPFTSFYRTRRRIARMHRSERTKHDSASLNNCTKKRITKHKSLFYCARSQNPTTPAWLPDRGTKSLTVRTRWFPLLLVGNVCTRALSALISTPR